MFVGDSPVEEFIRTRSPSRDSGRQAVVDPEDNVPDLEGGAHSRQASSRDGRLATTDPYDREVPSNPNPDEDSFDSLEEIDIQCVFCRRMIRSNWPVMIRYSGP